MKHYTISVSDHELEQLQRVYNFHQVEDENPYLLFHASHNGIDVLAYKTGKVLLQGDEISHELIAIKKHLGREDFDAVGSDEVGTGDVFGPIVVCAAFADVKDIEYLESLNVRDSKNMTDKSIISIAPKIAKRLVHSLLILPPKKYNQLTQKGYNLNKIKALLHNQAIIKTTSKIDKEIPVILDQFCTPQLYFNYIKDETLVYRNIDFHVKAEQIHLSVAAASIIARYAFLVKMREYERKLGIKLMKGASKDVDQLASHIHEKKGLQMLSLVAKMNFKNITKQNFT
ncbi:MAG: ribonuclease HIII [Acholeplasmataceae bacterium]|nr:ribonuclease HIII [Acholeplasmataceae bacterium]